MTIERAARAAYETQVKLVFGALPTMRRSDVKPNKAQTSGMVWSDLDPVTKEVWVEVAKAVMAEMGSR
jgi:hypothetical protein